MGRKNRSGSVHSAATSSSNRSGGGGGGGTGASGGGGANTAPVPSELLNFRFSSSPPHRNTNDVQHHPNSTNHRHHPQQHARHRGGGGGGGRGSNNRQQQHPKAHNKSPYNVPSNRVRKRKDFFYLYSSNAHAFVITRCHHHHHHPSSNNQQNQQQQQQQQQQNQESSLLQSTSSTKYALEDMDTPVSWECVRVVKCMVSASSREGYHACPICLQEDLAAPRITKCGHLFCLHCLIHHVHAFAASHPYGNHVVKCPCCAVPLHLCDVRPVQMIATITTTATTTNLALQQPITTPTPTPPTPEPSQATASVAFVKLHRAKHCACPYLPHPDQPKRSSPHACPSMLDDDALYSKFNYVDPTAYQSLLQEHVHALQRNVQNERDQSSIDVLCQNLAIEHIQEEIQRSRKEESLEREWMERFAMTSSGICQEQPKYLFVENHVPPDILQQLTSKQRPKQQQQQPYKKERHRSRRSDSVTSCNSSNRDADESGGVRSDGRIATGGSADPTSEDPNAGSRDNAVTTDDDDDLRETPTLTSETSEVNETTTLSADDTGSALLTKHSMYLESTDTETLYYQAQDGTLCFLCGFNMKCLQHEYSTTLSEVAQLEVPATATAADGAGSSASADDQEQQQQQQLQRPKQPNASKKMLPLPDVVEGRVLQVEHVHLSAGVRERLRFLSHLPVESDIVFVELALGHLLSNKTKKAFQKEFRARQQARQKEIVQDRKARAREERLEKQRVEELKARYQRIDPNDEFFQPVIVSPPPDSELPFPVGDDFGPPISTTNPATNRQGGQSSTQQAISFSQIIATRPVVSSRESDFPALRSSSTPANTNSRRAPPPQPWGKPTKKVVDSEGSSPLHQQANPVHDLSDSQQSQQASIIGGGSQSNRGKKSKGKKVVLFSTGGQRGNY